MVTIVPRTTGVIPKEDVRDPMTWADYGRFRIGAALGLMGIGTVPAEYLMLVVQIST